MEMWRERIMHWHKYGKQATCTHFLVRSLGNLRHSLECVIEINQKDQMTSQSFEVSSEIFRKCSPIFVKLQKSSYSKLFKLLHILLTICLLFG